MDQKPIYVFAKFQVREGQLDVVLNLLGQLTSKTIQEKGNLFYNVHQSNADQHMVFFFEGYRDEEAVQEHWNSPHFQDIVIEQLIPLMEDREVILGSRLPVN